MSLHLVPVQDTTLDRNMLKGYGEPVPEWGQLEQQTVLGSGSGFRFIYLTRSSRFCRRLVLSFYQSAGHTYFVAKLMQNGRRFLRLPGRSGHGACIGGSANSGTRIPLGDGPSDTEGASAFRMADGAALRHGGNSGFRQAAKLDAKPVFMGVAQPKDLTRRAMAWTLGRAGPDIVGCGGQRV
jgi:hypothetical protein